jgi:hypothetical protein
MFTVEITDLLEKAGCKGFYAHNQFFLDEDDCTLYIYCLVDNNLDFDTIYYPLTEALSEYCRTNHLTVNGKKVFTFQLVEHQQIEDEQVSNRYTWRPLKEILDKPSSTLTTEQRLTRLEQHLGYS